MGRITLAGALFLAVITVVLPLLTAVLTGVPSTSLYLGGPAILIVVGVALDTMKQIETQLLMRQYKGFIKGSPCCSDRRAAARARRRRGWRCVSACLMLR